MAYTYIIGWSVYNKWYYGVRYAKDCNPTELWIKYFTSSKHVKRFRMKYGEPDIIKIRKIFNDSCKAIKWEQKVLKRLNVEKRKDFLNAKNSTTNTIIINSNNTSFKKGNIPWNKNLIMSEFYYSEWSIRYSREKTEDELLKLSKKGKERFANIELREVYSERTKEQFSNNEFRELHKNKCISHSDKIWINDGVKNKRVTKEKYKKYFSDWNLGRIISEINLLKLKQGRNNGNKYRNREIKTS